MLPRSRLVKKSGLKNFVYFVKLFIIIRKSTAKFKSKFNAAIKHKLLIYQSVNFSLT